MYRTGEGKAAGNKLAELDRKISQIREDVREQYEKQVFDNYIRLFKNYSFIESPDRNLMLTACGLYVLIFDIKEKTVYKILSKPLPPCDIDEVYIGRPEIGKEYEFGDFLFSSSSNLKKIPVKTLLKTLEQHVPYPDLIGYFPDNPLNYLQLPEPKPKNKKTGW